MDLIQRFFVALAFSLVASALVAAEADRGKQLYQKSCVRCHGAAGEGTKHYSQRLAGDRPLADLAKVIAETMPDDDPGTCTGADAQAVAAYIYNEFYSPIAQARHRPARIELAHLTVRQYQNVLADLVGSFGPTVRYDDRRGLKAEYFRSRNMNRGERAIERTDAQVDFSYGESSPDPTKIKPAEFSAHWQGAVLPVETGDYEFVVRTHNGARLWVNGTVKPLIDAWVKSGNDTEYRAAIRLLGGRAYPLRLQFLKGKEKTASVALLWRPPSQPLQIVPERCLWPGWTPEVYVTPAVLPADDRSTGFERGNTVSQAWDQATTEGAVDAATFVAGRLKHFAGVDDKTSDRTGQLKQFARRFAERAFRRPLTDDEARLYVDRQFQRAADSNVALTRSLILVLKSPRFLYPGIPSDKPDAYETASRLALGLWDSLPDETLLKAAAAGKLNVRADVLKQTERMIADPRARAKVRAFLLQWLKVDLQPDLAKDPAKYPGFDPQLVADLRASLELFLDDVVWSEASDFRQLLLANQVYLNGRLAKFYGVNLPADAGFQKVPLDEAERAGVLSHPYLLSTFAYTASSSPIHRGVFLARSVVGRMLRPPPEAVAPLAADLRPELTTRERVALQTKPETCQACHGLINPLGFALERFDAVGRFRREENGKPIDATGYYLDQAGATGQFVGARALAEYLAGSPEVQGAFVEQLFLYLVKQPIRAYGDAREEDLRARFAGQGYSIRRLLIDIVTDVALAPAAPAEKT